MSLENNTNDKAPNNAEILKDTPIIIVDDEKSICETMKLFMEYQGIKNVETFLSGVDFLKAITEIPQNSNAVVLMDNNMPGKNGVTCAQEIREMGYSNLIIIMCSTVVDDKDKIMIDKALQKGILNDFIPKPANIKNVIAKIALKKTGSVL